MEISREIIKSEIYTQRTLGGRSYFEYAIEKGNLILRFGKMIDFIQVNKNIILKVQTRVKEMNFSTITSDYNQDKWKECPNNIICPYVACLIINYKFKI